MSTVAPPPHQSPFRLRLFGGVRLDGPDGPVGGRTSQRRQLAVLAVLAAADRRGVTREKLLGLLWGENDEAKARHQLSDALYNIRHELGDEAILDAGGGLCLEPTRVWCDAQAFDAAVAAEDREAATALYTGPFLDGFYLDGEAGFEEWKDAERHRFATAYAEMLEELARSAEARGDHRVAATWWHHLAIHDPYNSRVCLALMRALAAAGDPANALTHLAGHVRVLRTQLEIDPDLEVFAYAEQLRAELAPTYPAPSPGAPRERTPSADSASGTVGFGEHQNATPQPSRHSMLLRIRVMWPGLAVVAALVVGGLWIARRFHNSRGDSSDLDPRVYAVLPFDVIGTGDSLVRAFGRDIPRFFDGVGASGTPIRAADFDAVSVAWEQRGARGGGRLTMEDRLSVASAVGAGRLVVGRLMVDDGGAVLEATVFANPGGRLVTTQRVEAPWSDRVRLADGLVLKLLTAEFGDVGQFPRLGSYDRQAVFLYLEGLRLAADFRPRESSERFRAALAIDSTFADAAFAWYLMGESQEAMERVWTLRRRLTPRDSNFLSVDAGPRLGLYRSSSEQIEARASLARMFPEWSVQWAEFAQNIRSVGPYVWEDWLWQAWDAVNKAVALSDSTSRPLLYDAIDIDWQFGDEVRTRQLATRAANLGMDSQAPAWRWMVAYVLGDDRERARAIAAHATDRRFFPQWPVGLAIVGGEAFDDAESVLEIYTRRSPADGLTYAVPYWRTRGHYGRWRAARDSLFRILPLERSAVRMIAGAAYLGDDPDTVPDLYEALRNRRGANWRGAFPAHVEGEARCWDAHASLHQGRLDGIPAAIADLQADTTEGRDAAGLCAAMLDLQLRRLRGGDLHGAAFQLDSLATRVPAIPWEMEGMRRGGLLLNRANLLLARTWLELGDIPAARTAALRGRRSDVNAVATGDDYAEFVRLIAMTSTNANPQEALRYYDLYLRLRPVRPGYGPWAAQWDSVKAELAAIRGR